MGDINEAVNKRQEAIKLLHEFGIFFFILGLNKTHFKKINVVSFSWQLTSDKGFFRCSLCFRDFEQGE